MDELSAHRRSPFGTNPKVGERGRQTQQRILAAAFDVFGELGYSPTSVEAITDRAGCSRPTFYQYFGSKEELFRRLAGRFGEDLARLTADLGPIDATRDGRDEILAWIAQLLAVHERHRPIARGFAVSIRTDEGLRVGSSALVDRYRGTITSVLQDPLPSPVDEELLAGIVMVTVYGACNHREVAPGRLSRGRFIAALADIVHRCFFGPIAGVNTGSEGTAAAAKRQITSLTTEPPPSAAPVAAEQTRQRLATAAAAVFCRQGYELTSIDDIVDAADLSHGAFYRYFDDKPAAFREVALRAAGEMVARIEQLPHPADGLGSWCRAYYESYETHGQLFAVWPEATDAGVDVAVKVQRAVSSHLHAVLAGRTFGDVEADAVALLALLERGPSSVYSYGALSAVEGAAATEVFLERAFFGAGGATVDSLSAT